MFPADLPRHFFSPLTSKHSDAYVHVILSIESVLEQSKRIALPRTTLVAELRRIFQRENYALDVSDEEEYDEAPSGDFQQDNIAFTIRLLRRCGWIDSDETGDFHSETIFITSYGKKLTRFLKDLAKMEDQSGHVVNTWSNLQQVRSMPDSGFVCIQNAYESTEHLLTSLEMIYSKIKKYYTAVLVNADPEKLLEEHLYGYVEDVVDKFVFPIKVDDSVDRFKGPILTIIMDIESDTLLLEQVISSAVQTKRIQSKDDGWALVLKRLNYIKHNYNDIESYIMQLDEKNKTYIRVTRQKLSYMLSMDTSIKGDIIAILRDAKERPEEDWRKLSNCISLFDITQVTEDSFYKPRKRRIRNDGGELPIEESEPASEREINAIIDSGVARYTVSGVNDHVRQILANQDSITAQDIKLESDDDYLMAIFLAMNSVDRRSAYTYEVSDGMTGKGEYNIPDFVVNYKGGS